MSAHVYRAFDASDRLLYVGCTVNLESRLRDHGMHAPWWLFHERIDSVEYATRAEADAAEVLAIATEHPRWNIAGRSDAHPDGKATSFANSHWLDYDRDVQRRYRELTSEEHRLLTELRSVRMGLAGVRTEVEAIKNGFVLEDEDVA